MTMALLSLVSGKPATNDVALTGEITLTGQVLPVGGLKENSLGTVVLEYDGRVQRVTSDQEQDLTNGLIKVLQATQPKIYFVQGHGERDITGSAGEAELTAQIARTVLAALEILY